MAERQAQNRLRIDPYFSALIGYSALLFLLLFLTGAFLGTDTLGDAAVPFLFAILFYNLFVIGGIKAGELAVTRRVRQDKRSEAHTMLQYLRIFMLGLGVLCAAAVFLGSGTFAVAFQGSRDYTVVYMMLAASILPFAVMGSVLSYFSGAGVRVPVRWMVAMHAALSVIFLPICSKIAYDNGKRIADLLRKDFCAALYGAFGIMTGLAVASFFTALMLVIVFFLMRGPVRETILGDVYFHERTGINRQLLRHVLVSTWPVMLVFFLQGMQSIAALYMFQRSAGEEAFLSSVRMGYLFRAGYLWPGLFALILTLPMTGILKSITKDLKRSNMQTVSGRYSMLFRLFSYLCFPAAFFSFAAAPVLAGGESDFAWVLRICMLNILLCALALQMGLIVLHMQRYGFMLFAECAAFALQLCYCIFSLSGASPKVTSLAISGVLFYAVWDLILFLGNRDTFSAIHKELYRTGMVLLCAAVAALPVYFLSPVLYGGIGAFFSFVICALLYFIAFTLLTFFTGCADIDLLERLPGGGIYEWIWSLIFDRDAGYEEDEYDR
ncbi:MAG: hypothetical protein J6I56_04615 [Lachnospiraceae bacterium]|nr:hypothetical protein [Lachnospiraceae bacterium]